MHKSLLVVFGATVIGILVFVIPSFDNLRQKNLLEFELRGSGMEPAFPDHSNCQLDKNAYLSANPQREDVVLYTVDRNDNPNMQLVKRIIGLPGEQFMISNGQVYIDNEVLFESYVASSDSTFLLDSLYFKENTAYTIPKDSYVLLGDNRRFSLDSREIGFVEKSRIIGKIISCRK